MLFATGVVSHAETAVEAWVRRYGFEGIGSEDSACKVVTDEAANVIVAGYTDERFNSSPDMLVIKYSSAGVPLWTNRYNGLGNADDSVADIAVLLSPRNGDLSFLSPITFFQNLWRDCAPENALDQ